MEDDSLKRSTEFCEATQASTPLEKPILNVKNHNPFDDLKPKRQSNLSLTPKVEIRKSDKLMQQYPAGKVLSNKDEEHRDDYSVSENSFSPTSKLTSPLRSSKMTQMSAKGIIEDYVVET